MLLGYGCLLNRYPCTRACDLRSPNPNGGITKREINFFQKGVVCAASLTQLSVPSTVLLLVLASTEPADFHHVRNTVE